MASSALRTCTRWGFGRVIGFTRMGTRCWFFREWMGVIGEPHQEPHSGCGAEGVVAAVGCLADVFWVIAAASDEAAVAALAIKKRPADFIFQRERHVRREFAHCRQRIEI